MTDRIAEIDTQIAHLIAKVDRRRGKNRDDSDTVYRLRAEKRLLETPTQPPMGSIIWFVKRFAGNPIVYTYVAHRDERFGRWWVTGATGPNNATWETLIQFIRQDNLAPFGFEVTTTSPARLSSC